MSTVIRSIVNRTFAFILLFNLIVNSFFIDCMVEKGRQQLLPTVFVAILVRNKEHVLPYFFGYLERLSYPRERISLWIRSDHNVDRSVEAVKAWLETHEDSYHSVDFHYDDSPTTFADQSQIFEWSPSRYQHIIKLKEEALHAAKRKWAHYILFLDSDVFLTSDKTLELLIQEKRGIIAPVMDTLGAYSNFWCGMTEQGYYKRTDEYLPILEREKLGCFEVPMVHSVFLIDLQQTKSQNLTFDPKKVPDYTGADDDMLIFAFSAKKLGMKMYVLNRDEYGYMMSPSGKNSSLADEKDQLTNLKAEMMIELPEVLFSSALTHYLPAKHFDRLGLDQVYLINLERRSFKRVRMLNTLSELGIETQLFTAVDGKLLNDSYIMEMGIKMLPEYVDPYHKRPITRGEIGCFLSHYFVWKDMIAKQHRTALVFEDDLRFESHFRRKMEGVLKEIKRMGLLWDLIYLGRKRLSEENEPFVQGASSLVHVDYSYWTLCYLITLEGAKKLVSASPLPKIIPVDEFLPIMFDKHPQEVWKNYFTPRNLKAFSVHPLLVSPTHYTGEENYISDTEDSEIALAVSKDEL